VVKPIAQLGFACIASTILYLVAFAFLLHKPLTIGTIVQLDEERKAYVEAHPGPKAIVIAGSNGLYSFRCQTMEAVLDRPCVNLSLGAQAGLDFDLMRVRQIAKRNDIVVMPYEFEIYVKPASLIYGGIGDQVLIQHDRALLGELSPGRIRKAAFSFDFRFLVEAVIENLFVGLGIHGDFTTSAFSPQGDYIDNTAANAERFKEIVAADDMAMPKPDILTAPSAAQDVMRAFFAWSLAHGVIVVGSLPTTFDDHPQAPELVDRIERLYKANGAHYLVLPNLHQYPRSCFFDSHYHLAQPCQQEHSAAFARLIKDSGLLSMPASEAALLAR